MKVFISTDIEGICTVTNWNECDLEHPRFSAEQMSREVAAACRAALDFGAEEVVVKDSHDTGRNLIADMLPRGVKLIRGWSGGPPMMMEGLKEDFSATAYIGYHSSAGSNGNPLAHTISSEKVRALYLNDVLTSEFYLNHHFALHLGVPSIFLSGDKALCEEAQNRVPGLVTFAVKEGLGDATINLHPEDAIEGIYQGMKKALEDPAPLMKREEKIEARLDFIHHRTAYKASFFPGVRQVSPTEVRFEGNGYEIMRTLMFVL